MRRELTGHRVNPANDVLEVMVLDGPGAGGACHKYEISGFDTTSNDARGIGGLQFRTELLFQNGPINEVGVNGITHEALIAILIDRLECFQAGPYSNAYNARALESLLNAQDALLSRTRDRMRQGIEGTMAVGAETLDRPSQDPAVELGKIKKGTASGNPIMRYFSHDHLPEGPLREVSAYFTDAAAWMDKFVPAGAEKSAGLRKLLEAKDCFVRAALP